MATATRQRIVAANGPTMAGLAAAKSRGSSSIKVFVALENQQTESEFVRLLKKYTDVEIVGMNCRAPLDPLALAGSGAEVLLLASCGDLLGDLTVIRNVRSTESGMEIIMLGDINEEGEFLQCVRAGVCGYLARNASSEEI